MNSLIIHSGNKRLWSILPNPEKEMQNQK